MPDLTFSPVTPIANRTLQAALDSLIDHKTKPLGSLGRLEELGRQLGLIQQTTTPHLQQPAMLVFAADHGVTAEGISAYPQSVTWQMVENFLAGGAAINVFAREMGWALHLVDAGVKHDFGPRPGLIDCKIAFGTDNFARQPAMTAAQCVQALEHGRALVAQHAQAGSNVLGFGEMGIGNTTAAAALMHVLTGLPLAQCAGAGTGLDGAGVAHKQAVIARAVALHDAQRLSPQEVLATFGGFEITMITGAMLAAAAQRMVILVDGFIVSSAVLVAARLQPAVLDYCVFAHCSDENGHTALLEYLGAAPLLQLGLRLGEGTGCALALPLLQSAVAFMRDMASFESAAVSQPLSSFAGAAPAN